MRRFLLNTFLIIFSLLLTACVKQPDYLNLGQQNFQQQNYHLAYKQLSPSAQEGHPGAQYAVGYCYFYGLGVVEDQAKGIEWIEKAADQGYGPAVEAIKLLKTH